MWVEDASVHGIKPLLHSLLRRRLWRRGGQPQRKKENGVEAAGQNLNHALFDNRYSAVNMCNIQIRGRTQVTTVANIGRR